MEERGRKREGRKGESKSPITCLNESTRPACKSDMPQDLSGGETGLVSVVALGVDTYVRGRRQREAGQIVGEGQAPVGRKGEQQSRRRTWHP
eukprot:4584550-Heterocapsa_arctica.AAC.1